MRRALFFKIAGILVALLVLVSCETLSVVDSWRASDLPDRRFQKLLVANLTKSPGFRQSNEDILVAELRARGVEVTASHAFIPGDADTDREELAKAVNASGADGVITIQLVRIETRTRVEPGYGYPGYWYPYPYPSWNLYRYWGGTVWYDPPTIVTYETATIQANLFDAASGRLLWAVTMETTDPRRDLGASKELARIITYGLMKEGLI
ncbi:MAG: DUF4136 domain-containing protein [Desulfuromonadales bacterium]|nr:MAG: DUF4136 domain-containing protein [Desulfuromonadales bacterium]